VAASHKTSPAAMRIARGALGRDQLRWQIKFPDRSATASRQRRLGVFPAIPSGAAP
jgi:hypothetical protein